jgi:hypothetical protein
MNTMEIKLCFDQYDFLDRRTLGVFAADNLPRMEITPCCFIANTDDSKNPGRHWVAFYSP